MLRIVIIINC